MAPSEILPGLFLGNDTDSTEAARYDVVVNCTPQLPFHDPSKRCIRVPVQDDPFDAYPLYMILRDSDVLADIHAALEGGRSVLVHCQAGAQRSPAVVSAYLIRHREMSARAALDFVKGRRAQAFFWQATFWRTLELLEAAEAAS